MEKEIVVMAGGFNGFFGSIAEDFQDHHVGQIMELGIKKFCAAQRMTNRNALFKSRTKCFSQL